MKIKTFLELFLQIFVCQHYFHNVFGEWPLLNSSTLKLLGLFSDAENTTKPTIFSVQPRAMFQAALLLAQKYNITINGQFIGAEIKQTGGSPIGALTDTCQTVTNTDIVGIVGPSFSREADFIAAYAGKIRIPVISQSTTSPDLSDRNAYPTFYRTIPSDTPAAEAIVSLFLRYNWTSCIIIYQNDAFGSGGEKIISELLNANGLTVNELIIFDIVSLKLRGDLKSILIGSTTRIIILWTDLNFTPLILKQAMDADVLGPQYLWICTYGEIFNSFNATAKQKLTGMISVEATTGSAVNAPINSTLLDDACQLWEQYEPSTFPGKSSIDYYALFAFDATWTLIQALYQLCSNTNSSCLSIVNSSFCFDRSLIEGDRLSNLISTMTFLGVTGMVQFSSNLTDRINGNYFIVKNAQSVAKGIVAVPVLVWSDVSSWQMYTPTSIILWPGNTLIPPTGRANMNGIILRIGIMETTPFTMQSNITDAYGQISSTTIGYIPDLIELLSSEMSFIPQITLVPLNHTYNNLIDDIVNGVFDIVVGDVTITASRRERVTFSSSIFDNSLRIIIRKKGDKTLDLMAFLRPLSLKLWIVLVAVTFTAGFLICFFERNTNDILQNRSIFSATALSIWFSFGNIVGYGADFHVTTAAGRLLTAGLYMISLVIIATYTANLASDFTTEKTKNIISGIDEIKNGKLAFSRVGIVVDSSIEDYYRREISGGIQNYYPLKRVDEIYSSLINNLIDAAIWDIGALEYATSSVYCNLTLVGTSFDNSAFGIVVPRNWLYIENLDVAILELRESGKLDDLRRKWFQGSTCTSSSDISTAATIESMSGLMITFLGIAVLASFVYIWKIWCKKINCLCTFIYRLCLYITNKKKTVILENTIATSSENCSSYL